MGFFISTGVNDKFGHPDYFVTSMFYTYAKQISGLLEHFPCYRTYSDRYSMPSDLPPLDGGWFIFSNRRRMYTTVFAVNTNGDWEQGTRTEHRDFPDEEELWKNRR